ncbi:MAG: disulfide bond formation protein B [Salinisphaera sp.]|nr:disulfide bond formation protein B [Salinisphaera sp.]
MNYRLLASVGWVAAFGALGFAYVLEYGFGLQPCPLCIFQRIAMFATGLVFLVAALHGPRAWGRWLYTALAVVAAGVGAAIAARHVWLLHLPADQVPACGPGLAYLRAVLPWREMLATVLRGDASCADIKAAFLGLSLPAWTMIGFLALALWGLIAPSVARR